MRAFAAALDSVPLALAENSGLAPIETLAQVKSQQVTEGNSKLGIDCAGRGHNGELRVAVSLRVLLSIGHRYEGAVCL